MGDTQKKSGGAKKIGRNKDKCTAYRYSKGKWNETGNKKPKGYGNLSTRPKPVMPWNNGKILDLHTLPEDKQPMFRPRFDCPHLSTELLESSKLLGHNRHPGTFEENAQELSRHLKAGMRKRVLYFPERPKRETVGGRVVRKVL